MQCVHATMRSIMPKGCHDMPFVTLDKSSSGVKTKATILADHSLAREGLRLCELVLERIIRGPLSSRDRPEEITDAADEKE
jgi:hypothetical protein